MKPSFGAIGAAWLVCAVLTPAASACSLAIEPWPEVPAGLSAAGAVKFQEAWLEAYRKQLGLRQALATADHQSKLWEQSESVILARVETEFPQSETQLPDGRRDVEMRGVALLPVRWLKGMGKSEPFVVRYAGMSSCGPVPDWDALRGGAGAMFVIYVRWSAPSQATILDTIAPDRIVDPWVKAALTLEQ